MVEKFSQHTERPIFAIAKNQCDHNDRCFNDRLWGSYGKTDFSGSLEFGTETFVHKLFGNESCNFDSSAFMKILKGKCVLIRSDNTSIVQYINRQGGTKSPNLCFLTWELWQIAIQNNIVLKAAHIMDKKNVLADHLCREKVCLTEWSLNKSIVQQLFSDIGNPIDRFVCIMGKSQDRNILHLDSSSQCFGLGCSDNSLGEHLRVCVPPNMSDSKDIAIYEAVPLSDNFDCTPVAKETLVHRDFAVTDSLSNKTTSNGQFVVSGQNENFSSKSRNIKSDSMASFNRRFKTEGFSQSVRTLFSASRQDGTKKDFSSKFEKFNSWCGERQIDPYSANFNQVADFLAYLFLSGLQYRTIAGYRSMLSAVLPPVQNFPVAKQPYIVRIIKGVFNSRPPKVKILPEWNLELLLQALEKKPFEPMQEVDLKHVTLKTVFLVAITTFSRCSDLQSLGIDDKSMRDQCKGITFVRHGLAKQDRQKHFGEKLFVPSFPEKTLIDPKRALSAIRIAYDDDNMKVNVHSTRAIAPSWALYKGASLKSILDSDNWAIESTFPRFYLRDFDATKVSE
ncbi:unnamed protein product [Mytilus coruscus]|uniref:Core-binding (CB) domain-containing protein n=1 Tax=Mytilus coruscus TaxID=42192 RepID=A0A6J8CRD8_MYTCO|nr:unnamed protein product [Mytilus coruscus]